MLRKFSVLTFAVVVVLSGCSRHSELHEAMETMGDAFKAIREESDLATIKAELATLKTAMEIAAQQKVAPEDQVTFDEGMQKTQSAVAELEKALAEGSQEQVADLVKKLGSIRKDFHDKLGVK